MSKYIMRLDDAATKMNIEKWHRMEQLLNSFIPFPTKCINRKPSLVDYILKKNYFSRKK